MINVGIWELDGSGDEIEWEDKKIPRIRRASEFDLQKELKSMCIFDTYFLYDSWRSYKPTKEVCNEREKEFDINHLSLVKLYKTLSALDNNVI